MRSLLVFVVLLAGCATTPPENPWQGLTVDTDPAASSVDCGRFPLPSDYTEAMIIYDQAGANALEAYRVCSEANLALVDLHADNIAELKIARAALVEAGQAQRNIAAMRLEMLEDERRHNAWTSIAYWVVIGALGAAAF